MRVYKYTSDSPETRTIAWLPEHAEYNSKFLIIKNKKATVKAGYSWNGCSPKFKIFGKTFGTPDGKNDECKYATKWHDAFYQYSYDIVLMGIQRKYVDLLFKQDLELYNWKHTNFYYKVVKKLGWINWEKKSRLKGGK